MCGVRAGFFFAANHFPMMPIILLHEDILPKREEKPGSKTILPLPLIQNPEKNHKAAEPRKRAPARKSGSRG